MAKDVYYFPHDANARNDIKTVNMMSDYGMAGYGMYWFIVETLREAEGYKLQNNKQTWRALARQMCINAQEVEKFIQDCIDDYELFATDGIAFWSNSLLKRMGKVDEIRMKRSEASRKRWEKNKQDNANAMQLDSKSNANAMQTDANKIKEKEKKENKIYKAIQGVKTVKITEEEYKDLTEQYDISYVNGMILRMEAWLTEHNKTYNDYATNLRSWIENDKNKVMKKKEVDYSRYKNSEPPADFKDW